MAPAIDNPRLIGLEILLEWEKSHRKLNEILQNALVRFSYLPRQDRAFIKNLTEGTVERLLTLDHVLDSYSKVPSRKMKPLVRGVLRLSVYQLLFLSHVPPSAVCNEAVKMIRRKGAGGLSGFVNGVLRSIVRNMPDLSAIEDLSIKYSTPEWIVDRFCQEYGRDAAEKILQSFVGARPIFIRANQTRIGTDALCDILKDEGVEVRKELAFVAFSLPDMDYALEIRIKGGLEELKSFREGLFSVQDLSSMAVVALAAPNPGDRVLDICAAPGGKACHAAELLKGSGSVIARDVSYQKVALIQENRDRLGLSNLSAEVADARVFEPEAEEKADLVIADLPCSGLGVMGRKNDLKYRVRPEDINSLSDLQRQILENAVRYVKPGGRLVFSVCTLTREETREQSAFLKGFPTLTMLEDRLILPENNGPDGFYIAVFRKAVKGDEA
ncbi:MAG: 16S rRNA (cytosine(967)-C(5))-methyltransferase RsmB [Lachnospiraceae bacterium]|nr:16S rRNA (cytosine(967)-C(5))-methyltransferase RsmB [Lachnospiraceae bacterium]